MQIHTGEAGEGFISKAKRLVNTILIFKKKYFLKSRHKPWQKKKNFFFNQVQTSAATRALPDFLPFSPDNALPTTGQRFFLTFITRDKPCSRRDRGTCQFDTRENGRCPSPIFSHPCNRSLTRGQ